MKNQLFKEKELEARRETVYGILKSKGLKTGLINIVLDVVNLEFQYRIIQVNNFIESEGFKVLDVDGKVRIEEEYGVGKISMANRVIYIKRGN